MPQKCPFNCRQLGLIGEFIGMPQQFKNNRRHPIAPLNDALDHLLQTHICRWERLDLLQSLWVQIVGNRLATGCQPSSLRGTTLTICTDCRAFAQELFLEKKRILDRVRQLPELENIIHLHIAIGGQVR